MRPVQFGRPLHHRTAEQQTYLEKKNALFVKWEKARLFDRLKFWSQHPHESKIVMVDLCMCCCDASIPTGVCCYNSYFVL